MREFGAIATLVVGGIIVADVLTHPTGTKTAGNAINQLTGSAFTALLGGSNTGGK